MATLLSSAYLIFAAVCAFFCYKIARKNQWNKGTALSVGLLAPLIALPIYVYITSDFYKRIHQKGSRSRFLKRWSFVLGGGIVIAASLSSMKENNDVFAIMYSIMLLFIGGYLIYFGLVKCRKIL
ncbi:MAG: hypothetical protein G01um101417_671 [Parcubacteria group bacterium Gr01-1014_17]|nr:MAG: hypothetical protein G01um101417_671 [Parcubacteria group bacterium Gr01-1014_17]